LFAIGSDAISAGGIRENLFGNAIARG